ncbi:MAG: sulfite exporter TauE/SafE family protein [Hyphomicrobiales bacterium]
MALANDLLSQPDLTYKGRCGNVKPGKRPALDLSSLIVPLAAYLIAGLVKGTTGLGFSTTCLPILAISLGLKESLPLIIVPSLMSNVTVMRDAGHFRETVTRFWPLYVALLPGLAGGLALLAWVDGATAAVALGIVLCLYAAYGLARPATRIEGGLVRPLAPPVGFITGFINGLTGTQVMPLLPYMLALQLDPNRLVQAINCSFTLSSLIMAAGLARLELFTLDQLAISVLGIVPALAGVKLGGVVRRRIGPETFRKMVLIVLLVLGVSLMLR